MQLSVIQGIFYLFPFNSDFIFFVHYCTTPPFRTITNAINQFVSRQRFRYNESLRFYAIYYNIIFENFVLYDLLQFTAPFTQ